jgi:hypothetical protein
VRSSQAIMEFSEFIFEQGLIDIPLVEGRSSWSNCRVWSRIDRLLPSSEWERGVSKTSSSSAFGSLSIAIGLWGRGSFKFENKWLQVEGFEEQVKRWWGSYTYEGTPNFARKLKTLKIDLKKWNEKEFGNVGVQKKNLEKGLSELDLIADETPLFEEENFKREDYSRNLERHILLEEVSWR